MLDVICSMEAVVSSAAADCSEAPWESCCAVALISVLPEATLLAALVTFPDNPAQVQDHLGQRQPQAIDF